MEPQLKELIGLAQGGRDQAQDALDNAERAADEADSVKQVIFSSCTENHSIKFLKNAAFWKKKTPKIVPGRLS